MKIPPPPPFLLQKLLYLENLQMCTGIFLETQDEFYVAGRTLDFKRNLDLSTYITEDCIGISTNGFLLDGMNAYGLCAMALYFPDNTTGRYSTEQQEGKINLSSWEVVSYILTHGKDVLHVVESVIPHIVVTDSEHPEWGCNIPLHWVIGDTSGNYKVLEVNKEGIIAIHNNEKFKVITNSPDFPQHIAALSKYENLSGKDREAQTPQGTGSLGLPGDFSSISRFVRARFIVKNTPPQKDLESNVKTAFHILNNFDIPEGSVIDSTEDIQSTLYTVVYDLRNFQYFLRTRDDPNIKVVRYTDVEQAINKGLVKEQTKSTDSHEDIIHQTEEKSKSKGGFWWILIILVILGVAGYCIWRFFLHPKVKESATLQKL